MNATATELDVELLPADNAVPSLLLVSTPVPVQGWPDAGAADSDSDSDAELDVSASSVLDRVMSMPAGPAAVGLLAAIAPDLLDSYDRVLLLRAWQRQTAFCEAMTLRAMAGVVDDAPDPLWVADEVAAAARISRPAADRKLSLCRRLARVLTATGQALTDGDISYAHALALHDETLGLSPELAREAERRLLARAPEQTASRLRSAARKTVARLDPAGFAERHRQQQDNLDVGFADFGDGVGHMWSTMTTPDAATVKTAINAWADAHRHHLPGLTVGQRRVAALVTWSKTYLADPSAPRRHGRPANIDVVIDLPTLLGMADHPGEVPGYGPIPAYLARRLAADGSWRRLVTDPLTGHLLDCAPATYRPSQALRDFLLARERVSGFPGSTVPAQACDLDHTDPHAGGGATCPANLGPLDRRAHRAKTTGGWRLRRHRHGCLTWTSPAGHTYRTEPHDYRLGP